MSEFEHLGVHQWLSKQCAYMALHNPTPIQRLCIPAILAGKHVVGGAATGSGKTAAFALPLLQILAEDLYGVFTLVLTPSRELAYQIVDQFVALGAPLQARTALIIGGVPHEQQLDALNGRPHIVVGTPGRLRFILATFPEARRAFSHLRFLVLDEADRLTSDDMASDVSKVVQLLGPAKPTRRTLLFTATLESRLSQVTTSDEEEALLPQLGIHSSTELEVFASNTVQLPTTTTPTHSVVETLVQKYIFIPNAVKLAYLVATLRGAGSEQSTIVFTNSCMRCEVVRLTLQLLGFPVCSLNSIISQKNRLDNLATFKLGIARILVATDIASRGLDIPAVGLVLHYDLPKQAPTYLHRVGRTARAGREGLSVAFVTEYDVELVQRLEKRIQCKLDLWKQKDVCEKRVVKILDEVSAAKVQAQLQVEEQFGRRISTLKEHAAAKRAVNNSFHGKQIERGKRGKTSNELHSKDLSRSFKSQPISCDKTAKIATRKRSLAAVISPRTETKHLPMMRSDELGNRSLPSFDNHYSNGVLMENWQEDRIHAATGRVFTIGSYTTTEPNKSIYTTDYVSRRPSSVQPMMRHRGLGKELMFGTGKPEVFTGAPTSTTYGESQRHIIESKYGSTATIKSRKNENIRSVATHTFTGNTLTNGHSPTADEEVYLNYTTTRTAMDVPVACYQFQRQMTKNC